MSSDQFRQEAQSAGYSVNDGRGQGGHSVATRGGQTLQHWESTGTVSSTIDHHKFSSDTHWNKDCYRRDLNTEQVRSVIDNPRAHTGQGYIPRK